MDSAVVLWWARRRFREVRALTFHVAYRAGPERRAARLIARAAGARLDEIAVPFLHENHDPDRPRGYIPSRNLVFYSIALSRAEASGAGAVVGGHTRGDAARFRDAGRPFFRGLESLAASGGYPRVRVLTPLARLDKAGVVRLGLRLGVPLHLTWSCYGRGPRPCGRCPACREREAAFAKCGVADPGRSRPLLGPERPFDFSGRRIAKRGGGGHRR